MSSFESAPLGGSNLLRKLIDVTVTQPANNDILSYTNGQWINAPNAGAAGQANTASSAGGESLVLPKSGVDLPFKGLVAGTNITLTPSADTISISSTATGGATALTGLSDVNSTLVTAEGRALTYDTSVSKWNSGSVVNTISNTTGGGAGIGLVLKEETIIPGTGNTAYLRNITSGTGILVTEGVNDIVISNAQPGVTTFAALSDVAVTGGGVPNQGLHYDGTNYVQTPEFSVETASRTVLVDTTGAATILSDLDATLASSAGAVTVEGTLGSTLNTTGGNTVVSCEGASHQVVLTTATDAASYIRISEAAADYAAKVSSIPSAVPNVQTLSDAVSTSAALKVSKAGDTMTGALVMGANKVTSTFVPVADEDVTNKLFVDSSISTSAALKVSKAGDTMTGALAMGANKVTSSAVPTANEDLTNKLYVDSAIDASVPPTGPSSTLFSYKASTDIIQPPASGYVEWDNATQISSTSLAISHLTDDTYDVELILFQYPVGTKILVQDRNDSANFQTWTISGQPIRTIGSFVYFPVTYVAGGYQFSNNHQIIIVFTSAQVASSYATLSDVSIVGRTTGGITIYNSTSGDYEPASEIRIDPATRRITTLTNGETRFRSAQMMELITDDALLSLNASGPVNGDIAIDAEHSINCLGGLDINLKADAGKATLSSQQGDTRVYGFTSVAVEAITTDAFVVSRLGNVNAEAELNVNLTPVGATNASLVKIGTTTKSASTYATQIAGIDEAVPNVKYVNDAVVGGTISVANVGTGTGKVYRDTVGTTVNLKSVATGSTKLTVANNADTVSLDVDPAVIAIGSLLNAPTGAVVGTTDTQTLTNKTLTAPIVSTISNTGTLTLPTTTDTLVGRATTDTLTNKTLTAPVISSISNTGTLTLPTTTDTLVGRATTDTLTNKTLVDASTTFQDDLTNTKRMQLQLSGITAATTRTLTVPDADITLLGTAVPNTTTTGILRTAGNNNIASVLKSEFAATAPPAVGNDASQGYAVGSRWVDTTNDKEYICLDATNGAAVWKLTTGIAQTTGITAANAVKDNLIYDATENKLNFYTGTNWKSLNANGIVFGVSTNYSNINATYSPLIRWIPSGITGTTAGALSWPSSVGSGTIGVMGASLNFVTGAIGGKNAVYVNPTSNTDVNHKFTLNLGATYAGSAGFTVIAVVQDMQTLGVSSRILSLLDATPETGFAFNDPANIDVIMTITTTTFTGYYNAVERPYTTTVPVNTSLNTPTVVAISYNPTGTVYKMWINKLNSTTQAVNSTLNLNALTTRNIGFGFMNAGNEQGRIKVSEVLFWNSALSDGQISNLSGDLLSEYNNVVTGYYKTGPPTSSNDSGNGHSIGGLWTDTTNDKQYVCLDATNGSALWKEITKQNLSEQNDVAITAPLMGEVIAYDSVAAKWKNNALIWNDLIGYIENPTGAANDPPDYTLIAGLGQYGHSMRATGDTDMYIKFHPNHNWRPGLDFDFHVHMFTSSAAEAGTANFQVAVTYAQIGAAFPVETTLTTVTKVFTAGDQLKHFVVEVPMGRSEPTVSQIDSDLVDVDSIIMVRLRYNSATSTIAIPQQLYVVQADIHYQSYGAVGTRLQAPPFD